jgi:hypothetical protein
MIITLTQKDTDMKLGTETSSISNWIMSEHVTQPQVGKGMTELHWTDRTPWEVIYVSPNNKEVHVVMYNTKYRKDGYDGYLELDGIMPDTLTVLKYRHGAWRRQTDWGWSKMNVIFGCAQGYRDPHF